MWSKPRDWQVVTRNGLVKISERWRFSDIVHQTWDKHRHPWAKIGARFVCHLCNSCAGQQETDAFYNSDTGSVWQNTQTRTHSQWGQVTPKENDRCPILSRRKWKFLSALFPVKLSWQWFSHCGLIDLCPIAWSKRGFFTKLDFWYSQHKTDIDTSLRWAALWSLFKHFSVPKKMSGRVFCKNLVESQRSHLEPMSLLSMDPSACQKWSFSNVRLLILWSTKHSCVKAALESPKHTSAKQNCVHRGWLGKFMGGGRIRRSQTDWKFFGSGSGWKFLYLALRRTVTEWLFRALLLSLG